MRSDPSPSRARCWPPSSTAPMTCCGWWNPTTFGLTTFNAAFATYISEVYGVTVREGHLPEDVLPPELADRWRTFYARALTEGAFSFEYQSSSGTHALLLSIHVVQYDGQPLGVSVFGKDITALKQAEAERDRIRLQFLEAQKMESLGSLAGGVAHDFNNMLAGIMGHADLLMAGEPNAVRQEQLKSILQAATRSSELTRKLLAFARRGKNIVESVDLNAAVRESMTMLAPSLAPDVTTTLTLQASHPVDVDPTQLNQLIVNLCSQRRRGDARRRNAGRSDARGPAGCDDKWPPEAGARALRRADGRRLGRRHDRRGTAADLSSRSSPPRAAVTIERHRPRTAHRLRGGASASGSHQGGLGAWRRHHLHGSVSQRHSGRACRLGGQAVPGGSGLVLVVEDEAVLRQLATTALAHLGYRALTACDGVEGVDLFRTHHRELAGVLLDLKMPRMAGRETFLEMHAIDANVPVPAVLRVRRERGGPGPDLARSARPAVQAVSDRRAGRAPRTLWRVILNP